MVDVQRERKERLDAQQKVEQLKREQRARALRLRREIEDLRSELEAERNKGFWRRLFGGTIASKNSLGEERKKKEIRAMECVCGQRLGAADDGELFERARNHIDRNHPERGISDAQIHNLIRVRAYDAERAPRV